MSAGTIPPLPPLQLTRMEAVWLLRRMRADKDGITADMLAIEERIRSGHNGALQDAHRALDSDAAIADLIIRKLWQITDPIQPTPTPPPGKVARKK